MIQCKPKIANDWFLFQRLEISAFINLSCVLDSRPFLFLNLKKSNFKFCRGKKVESRWWKTECHRGKMALDKQYCVS